MKQVVLITGASSGIGMEAARLLAKDNYIVYGAARRLDRMKALEADGIRLLAMDVTDDASMIAGIRRS
jgi:NADP-dependent 3-hydroxy acid dehydrogenase YdfG